MLCDTTRCDDICLAKVEAHCSVRQTCVVLPEPSASSLLLCRKRGVDVLLFVSFEGVLTLV